MRSSLKHACTVAGPAFAVGALLLINEFWACMVFDAAPERFDFVTQ